MSAAHSMIFAIGLFLQLLITVHHVAAFHVTPPTTALHHTQRSSSSMRKHLTAAAAVSSAKSKGFAVIVQAEIEPDRMGEFLELIETNAVATRKEPGCIRFDVLRSCEAETKFVFYELYRGPEAIEYHKEQPHYKLWADFKESGGTVSSVTTKADAEFLT